jgi:predicted amidophosphoribosyltransferase
MTIECPKCQTDNPDSQKFCGDCGTPLEADVVHTKTIETPTEELTRGTVFAGRYEFIEELGTSTKTKFLSLAIFSFFF